jgi:hypothetical protein
MGGTYNQGQGPDVITREQVTEVETTETIEDGLRQLRGFASGNRSKSPAPTLRRLASGTRMARW